MSDGTGGPVRYEQRGAVAVVTLNRPRYRNAQNSAMTYALDAAFARAVNAEQVSVIVLAGAGDHFCAGHDIGTPGRDADVSFDRQAVLWWDHVAAEGADARYAREMEVYLGMCRRWREMPKPAIAMVQGACIAGGLMLAWVCDLIVAAEDAFFADPVVRMGIPGVEYFAHPWMLGPRFAKEVLFTGERFDATRAYQVGMVNQVVPRAELAAAAFALADRVARMPRFGLALAKRAVNHCEDLMGMRPGMDSVFGLHHLAHAHNAEVTGDPLAGLDARGMKARGGQARGGQARGGQARGRGNGAPPGGGG
jgi:enoyl-CoA hydratase/carnithine racemase